MDNFNLVTTNTVVKEKKSKITKVPKEEIKLKISPGERSAVQKLGARGKSPDPILAAENGSPDPKLGTEKEWLEYLYLQIITSLSTENIVKKHYYKHLKIFTFFALPISVKTTALIFGWVAQRRSG